MAMSKGSVPSINGPSAVPSAVPVLSTAKKIADDKTMELKYKVLGNSKIAGSADCKKILAALAQHVGNPIEVAAGKKINFKLVEPKDHVLSSEEVNGGIFASYPAMVVLNEVKPDPYFPARPKATPLIAITDSVEGMKYLSRVVGPVKVLFYDEKQYDAADNLLRNIYSVSRGEAVSLSTQAVIELDDGTKHKLSVVAL